MLVDKICKYEMDPAGIVEDTESGHNLVYKQKERRTGGRTSRQNETSIPLINL